MRGIEHLVEEARQKAELLVSECAKQGLIVKITDTLRTEAEQNDLYNQGRTTSGNIVTNCKYPNSMHNWGVAFDICRNDGRGAYNDSDGWFTKVGLIGEALGLEWGGHFKSFVDKPHFQLKQYGSTPKLLKSKFSTPKNFMSQIKSEVNNSKDYLETIEKDSRGWCVCLLQSYLFKDINEVDGIFGNKTKEKVLTFQKNNDLVVDGIVGKNTWNKILDILRR